MPMLRSVIFTEYLDDPNFCRLDINEASDVVTDAVRHVQGSLLPPYEALKEFQTTESYFTATHPAACPVARSLRKEQGTLIVHRRSCDECANETARVMAQVTGSVGASVSYVSDGVTTASGSWAR